MAWTFDWPEGGVPINPALREAMRREIEAIDERCHRFLAEAGMFPELEWCSDCGAAKAKYARCTKCHPNDLVACPYSLGKGHNPKCIACKGTGFVEELK